MSRTFRQYIPQNFSEIREHLSMMILKSPTFKDDYFVGQNIDTVFYALNEGLNLTRENLGVELYGVMIALSDRMRSHFEADPEDMTEDAVAGREIILKMQDLLPSRGTKSGLP